MITTILFDLDGTLLPMDQEQFLQAYLKGLCTKAAPRGYDPKKLTDSIWAGTGAMIQNSSQQSNEAVFWDVFAGIHGEDSRKDVALFEDFYHKEFQSVQASCGFQPLASTLIGQLKAKGFQLILATNPIFPAIATESRIRWAGLQPEDFEHYTTYENSYHCKPNLAYYQDILTQHCLSAEECLMVGNDVEEDMIVTELGMQTFLVTNCLINKHEKNIDAYPHGSFSDLMAYLQREFY